MIKLRSIWGYDMYLVYLCIDILSTFILECDEIFALLLSHLAADHDWVVHFLSIHHLLTVISD